MTNPIFVFVKINESCVNLCTTKLINKYRYIANDRQKKTDTYTYLCVNMCNYTCVTIHFSYYNNTNLLAPMTAERIAS